MSPVSCSQEAVPEGANESMDMGIQGETLSFYSVCQPGYSPLP